MYNPNAQGLLGQAVQQPTNSPVGSLANMQPKPNSPIMQSPVGQGLTQQMGTQQPVQSQQTPQPQSVQSQWTPQQSQQTPNMPAVAGQGTALQQSQANAQANKPVVDPDYFDTLKSIGAGALSPVQLQQAQKRYGNLPMDQLVQKQTNANKALFQTSLGMTNPSGADMYLAHTLGQKDAISFTKARLINPETPVTAALSPDTIAANQKNFLNSDGTPKTVSEVYAALKDKFPNKIMTTQGNL